MVWTATTGARRDREARAVPSSSVIRPNLSSGWSRSGTRKLLVEVLGEGVGLKPGVLLRPRGFSVGFDSLQAMANGKLRATSAPKVLNAALESDPPARPRYAYRIRKSLVRDPR